MRGRKPCFAHAKSYLQTMHKQRGAQWVLNIAIKQARTNQRVGVHNRQAQRFATTVLNTHLVTRGKAF